MVVAQNGHTLEYASPGLRDDREVLLVAVSTSGLSLQFGSRLLKEDRAVLRAAVSQNGNALRHANGAPGGQDPGTCGCCRPE